MISKVHIPDFPLNQFIDHFFYYTACYPEHRVERFLPDGEVQFIIDLTNKAKSIYDNESLVEVQSCQNFWFSGFRTEPITIPAGHESEMLIVQFKKGKAFSFLNEPMNQLTNYVVDAQLVLKTELVDARESLLEAHTPEEKFQILEKRLLEIYMNQLEENPFVDFAIAQIINSPSQCSMKEISRKAGFSQKHIIKIFKEKVGVTPKEFLKVIRFQNAVRQIEEQKNVDWSAIAHDCGFYDQSHFIADFKSFSGYTPTEYQILKGDVLNYIPIR